MAKAFWTIRRAVEKADGSFGPELPGLPDMAYWNPCDINVLTGSAQPHRHLVVGSVALPSGQVSGQYAFHYHYVFDNVQITVGAPHHVHDDANRQDYFMSFVLCSDSTYNTLMAGGVRPIVHCPVTVAGNIVEIGPMDSSAWSAGDLSFYQQVAVNILGIALPAEVDRGKRLVMFLLGLLQSRRPADDTWYRPTTYQLTE